MGRHGEEKPRARNGREQRRLKANWLVREAPPEQQLARRPLEVRELALLLTHLERGSSGHFGIAKLAHVALDAPLAAPARYLQWPGRRAHRLGGRITTLFELVRTACWRGKDGVVAALLHAGADPTLDVSSLDRSSRLSDNQGVSGSDAPAEDALAFAAPTFSSDEPSSTSAGGSGAPALEEEPGEVTAALASTDAGLAAGGHAGFSPWVLSELRRAEPAAALEALAAVQAAVGAAAASAVAAAGVSAAAAAAAGPAAPARPVRASAVAMAALRKAAPDILAGVRSAAATAGGPATAAAADSPSTNLPNAVCAVLARLPPCYQVWVVKEVVAMRLRALAPACKHSGSPAPNVGDGSADTGCTSSATSNCGECCCCGSGAGGQGGSESTSSRRTAVLTWRGACKHQVCERCVWQAFADAPHKRAAAAQLAPAGFRLRCPQCASLLDGDDAGAASSDDDEQDDAGVQLAEVAQPAVAGDGRGAAVRGSRGCAFGVSAAAVAAAAATAAASRAAFFALPSTVAELKVLKRAKRAALPLPAMAAATATVAAAESAEAGEEEEQEEEVEHEATATGIGSCKARFCAMDAVASAGLLLGTVQAKRSEALLRAAVAGDVPRLRALVAAGVNLEATDEYGRTALALAAAANNPAGGHEGQAAGAGFSPSAATAALACLLRRGASPFSPAHGGATPAAVAAAKGRVPLAALLARWGARPPVGYNRRQGTSPPPPLRPALPSGATVASCTAPAAAAAAAADQAAMRQLVGVDEMRAALGWGLWGAPATGWVCSGGGNAGDAPLARAESNNDAPDDEARKTEATAVLTSARRRAEGCCLSAPRPPSDQQLPPRVVTVLVPPERLHPGAGSYVIDGAFDEAFLRRLEATWRSLPAAPPEKASCSERAYFYDAEGWVRRAFARALSGVDGGTSDDDEGDGNECSGGGGGDSRSRTSSRSSGGDSRDGAGNDVCSNAERRRRWPLGVRAAMAPLRFLHYPHAGGALPPHIDLARAHPTLPGLRSTHTFLLYLSDCDKGGETALLDRLPAPTNNNPGAAVAAGATTAAPTALLCGDDPANTLAAVAPKRGRLLFFPHSCPHEGRAVVDAPKVCLRGELH